MARKRYTAEQIIGTLREAEMALAHGEPVAKVARWLGVAGPMYDTPSAGWAPSRAAALPRNPD